MVHGTPGLHSVLACGRPWDLPMPLARIILAGVNVLLAIVFMWLASASWGKRYAWSHAVFRHDMALSGLPVDEDERDENNEPIAGYLTDRTLQDILKGGSVVRTQ